MAEKRYVWLKLPMNFFESDTIAYIEEQENGIQLSAVYTKLLVKSAQTDGILVRRVGAKTISHTAASLAKMTGYPVEILEQAMDLFQELELMTKLEDGSFLMTEAAEMTGSESASASRMRKLREKEEQPENENLKQNDLVSREESKNMQECDAHVTSCDAPVTPALRTCDVDVTACDKNVTLEKEKEREEEEEKEREEKKQKALSGKPDPVSRVIDHLNAKTGKHFRPDTPKTRNLIKTRLKQYSVEDCCKVIDNMVSRWLKDEKMSQYLRPETLFSNKFESYLNTTPIKPPENVGYTFTNTKQWGSAPPREELPF